MNLYMLFFAENEIQEMISPMCFVGAQDDHIMECSALIKIHYQLHLRG